MSASAGIPLVSVVLATYNGEKFLRQQLDSIFAQTHPYIELIAVDDCSTDGTMSILHEYAARTAGMKVYSNEQNLGFIKNFEKGCRLSSGAYIALCDQDDYWYPEKIAHKLKAIGGHALVYCDSRLCDQDMKPLGRNISDLVNFQSFDNCLQLAVFCRMYGHAIFFTRELFGLADPFLEVIPPDWWLPYLATFHGGAYYLNEPLVDYRQHAANVTGVIGGKSKKKAGQSRKARKLADLEKTRIRIGRFYDVCPDEMRREKRVLGRIVKSYSSFSLWNDFRRVAVFLANRRVLLTVKRYSDPRKILFCLKMFINLR